MIINNRHSKMKIQLDNCLKVIELKIKLLQIKIIKARQK